MPDLTITLTPEQVIALRDLDPAPAKAAVQAHVDGWLAPLVMKARADERNAMIAAYDRATLSMQARVRETLGVG